MGDLDRGNPDDLIGEAVTGAVEVGEFLRREQHADPAGAPAREQREHVVIAQRGELVDPDERLFRDRLTGTRRLDALLAVARRGDQVLDRERPKLRRELPVPARVEAEHDDGVAVERPPQVDVRAGARPPPPCQSAPAPRNRPVWDSVMIASRDARPRTALSWSGPSSER